MEESKVAPAQEEKKVPQPEEAEEIDTECFICFTIMVEPVTLPCKHTFCRECLRKFFQTKVECPMCRAVPPANYKLKVNGELAKVMKKENPAAFEE